MKHLKIHSIKGACGRYFANLDGIELLGLVKAKHYVVEYGSDDFCPVCYKSDKLKKERRIFNKKLRDEKD